MDGALRSADEHPVRFDLLTENPVFKPFRYPWAYEAVGPLWWRAKSG